MKFKRMFLAVLLSIWLGLANQAAVAQSGMTLSFIPAQSNLAIAETSQINLAVTDGLNVMAYDVVIEYDAEILSLVAWAHGSFLSNLAVVYKVETPGLLHLACTQLATAPVSGSGNLLTLTFQGEALGTTALTISNAEISDALGNLTYPQTTNGIVEVINQSAATATITLTPTVTSTATPTPTRTVTPTRTATITHTRTATPTLTPAPSQTAASTSSAMTPSATLLPTAMLPTSLLQTPTDILPLPDQALTQESFGAILTTPLAMLPTQDLLVGVGLPPSDGQWQVIPKPRFAWLEGLLWTVLALALILAGVLIWLILRRRR